MVEFGNEDAEIDPADLPNTISIETPSIDVDSETRPPDDPSADYSPKSIHLMTIMVEGGMFVVAIAVGYFLAFHDRQQSLSEIASWPWFASMFWGTLAAIPIFAGATLLPKTGWIWAVAFSNKVEKLITPIFSNISILGLAWISLWAGIGEEFLFRWCLQGGLQELFLFPGGVIIALLIASVIFGVLHWIDRTYAILATIIGIYMGGLMLVSGTVLVPLFAHAVYDFVALVWLTRFRGSES